MAQVSGGKASTHNSASHSLRGSSAEPPAAPPVVEDVALREQIAELKQRLQEGGSESDWAQANSLQKICLDVVRNFLTAKISAAQLILVVKRLGEDAQDSKQPCSPAEPQQLVKYIMSAIWILATQATPANGETNSEWKAVCALMKEILSAGLVDQTYLKTTMEFAALVEAGIIRDEDSQQKRLIKVNTGLVYKQQKYNLLREEVEGYARLAVVLAGVPKSSHGDSDQVDSITAEVLSIIGHFDLDPNRVLDIVLDAFEQHPSSSSFLQLLKHFRQSNIVHVLGNKFLMYQEGTKRGCRTPKSLLYIAAVLISASYVELHTLLPYLHPSVEAAAAEIQSFAASLQAQDSAALRRTLCAIDAHTSSRRTWLSRAPQSVEIIKSVDDSKRPPPPAYPPPPSSISAANQAQGLALGERKDNRGAADAASHADGVATAGTSGASLAAGAASASAGTAAGAGPAEDNQVLGLCVALARAKAWSAMHSLLGELQASCQELRVDSLLCYSPEFTAAVLGLLRWASRTVFRGLKTGTSVLFADGDCPPVPALPNAQFPQLQSINQLVEHLQPLLSFLGYHLCEDTAAFAQVVVLVKAYIPFCDNEAALQRLCDVILLPMLHALAVSGRNATFLSTQLWSALVMLPYGVRYALYEVWQSAHEGKPALCLHAEKIALQGARHELKRLAKENTKQIGRNLSKYLHSSPAVVVGHLLNQIESFDNLVPYIVEALKFSTELSRDVCSLALISKLKTSKASKIKEGQTSYSSWFLSLSRFIATLYGRFPGTELKGLLHYLLQSVSQGQAADLLILKDLLAIMGGCTTLLEVSTAQLEGLAGGKALRGEILISAANSSMTAKQVKRASAMLRDELIASQTALPLLLFIAKIRSKILFEQSSIPLKLVSNLYDTAQDVLMQFADFLVSDAKFVESVAKLMPSFQALVQDIGLSVSVAFQLVRPIVRAALQFETAAAALPSHLTRWHPMCADVLGPSSQLLAARGTLEVLDVKLYLLFWSLSVYDIYAPAEKYSAEVKRLKDRYSELDNKKGTAAAGAMTSAEYNKFHRQREVDMKQLMATVVTLSEEILQQKKHVEAMREMMSSDMGRYFSAGASDESLARQLMQHFVLPRVMMSPLDAVYCAKFLFALHDLRVPGFPLLTMLNEMVRTFVPLLFSTTEAEASFLGYALNEVLHVVNRWQQSAALFELEYCKKRRARGMDTGSAGESGEEGGAGSEDILALLGTAPTAEGFAAQSLHAQYCELANDWHGVLCEGLLHGMSGGDYIYVRSALVVLSKLGGNFPLHAPQGEAITKALAELIAREVKREDLQIMARSVSVVVKKGSSVWAAPQDTPQPDRSAEQETKEGATEKGKEKEKEKDKEKDKDRPKEKEKDKDKEKEKERNKEKEKDKPKDKDSERDRERDRDRDRERDRDRDRERDRNRDRDRDREQIKPRPPPPAIHPRRASAAAAAAAAAATTTATGAGVAAPSPPPPPPPASSARSQSNQQAGGASMGDTKAKRQTSDRRSPSPPAKMPRRDSESWNRDSPASTSQTNKDGPAHPPPTERRSSSSSAVGKSSSSSSSAAPSLSAGQGGNSGSGGAQRSTPGGTREREDRGRPREYSRDSTREGRDGPRDGPKDSSGRDAGGGGSSSSSGNGSGSAGGGGNGGRESSSKPIPAPPPILTPGPLPPPPGPTGGYKRDTYDRHDHRPPPPAYPHNGGHALRDYDRGYPMPPPQGVGPPPHYPPPGQASGSGQSYPHQSKRQRR